MTATATDLAQIAWDKLQAERVAHTARVAADAASHSAEMLARLADQAKAAYDLANLQAIQKSNTAAGLRGKAEQADERVRSLAAEWTKAAIRL